MTHLTKLLEKSKELRDVATPVLTWYLHSDEVRGPWNKWITIGGPTERLLGSKGHICHASKEDDLANIHHIMNTSEYKDEIIAVLVAVLENLDREFGRGNLEHCNGHDAAASLYEEIDMALNSAEAIAKKASEPK